MLLWCYATLTARSLFSPFWPIVKVRMFGGFILQGSNTEKVTTTATQMLQALSTGDSSTARYAMQWNPLSQNRRRVGRPRITRNRIVE